MQHQILVKTKNYFVFMWGNLIFYHHIANKTFTIQTHFNCKNFLVFTFFQINVTQEQFHDFLSHTQSIYFCHMMTMSTNVWMKTIKKKWTKKRESKRVGRRWTMDIFQKNQLIFISRNFRRGENNWKIEIDLKGF